MSLKDSVLTDVPDSDKEDIVKQFQAEGATVTTKRQPDGKWTITAVFPPAAKKPVTDPAGKGSGSG